MRAVACFAAVAVAVLCLSGCRTMPPKSGIPAGYVSVPTSGDEVQKAVAPSGNRLVVKRHPNPPEGTLAFWREAVNNELTEGRGYEPLESGAVKDAAGREGWEMLYRVSRPEGEYLYLVTVRMAGGSVFVAEAGGREEALRPDLDALRASMR